MAPLSKAAAASKYLLTTSRTLVSDNHRQGMVLGTCLHELEGTDLKLALEVNVIRCVKSVLGGGGY
jgi:hypothetical protein